MAVDSTTNAANLASAENLVQINLGLDQIPQSQWSQDQMISYLQGLSSTINQYPTEFDSQTVANASTIGSSNLSDLALQDPSFSWSDFGSALEDNAAAAGNNVAALGQGISNAVNSIGSTISSLGTAASNTATIAQWALPAALVLLVYLLSQTKSGSVSAKGLSYARR